MYINVIISLPQGKLRTIIEIIAFTFCSGRKMF